MKIILILFTAISLFGSDYNSMIDSFENGDSDRAIVFARQNATLGNKEAMYNLALLYYSKGDIQRTEQWFNSSVKKGGKGAVGIGLIMLSRAQYSDVINSLNDSTSGTIRDSLVNVSHDLLENQDNASSQDYLLLGKLFYSDKIVHLNTKLALFLISKAADKGNREALAIMGDANNIMRPISLKAPLLTNSLSVALDYYMKASNLGDADSMAKMGELHIIGPRNIRMVQHGVDFVLKSANAGSPLGAKLLGDLYLQGLDVNGLGLSMDHKKALKWYQKATTLCEANSKLSTAQDYSHYYNSCQKESSITPGYSLLFEEF
ncbi:MAG: tetratricopeptide repeat protein [Campylobacterota bacterium]|nr:tetratricopeptide repeat protein [Campylobacterota bacterium]